MLYLFSLKPWISEIVIVIMHDIWSPESFPRSLMNPTCYAFSIWNALILHVYLENSKPSLFNLMLTSCDITYPMLHNDIL